MSYTKTMRRTLLAFAMFALVAIAVSPSHVAAQCQHGAPGGACTVEHGGACCCHQTLSSRGYTGATCTSDIDDCTDFGFIAVSDAGDAHCDGDTGNGAEERGTCLQTPVPGYGYSCVPTAGIGNNCNELGCRYRCDLPVAQPVCYDINACTEEGGIARCRSDAHNPDAGAVCWDVPGWCRNTGVNNGGGWGSLSAAGLGGYPGVWTGITGVNCASFTTWPIGIEAFVPERLGTGGMCQCSPGWYDDMRGVCRDQDGCSPNWQNGAVECVSGGNPDTNAVCQDRAAPLTGYNCLCSTVGWVAPTAGAGGGGRCEEVVETPTANCQNGGICPPCFAVDNIAPLYGYRCDSPGNNGNGDNGPIANDDGWDCTSGFCVDIDACTAQGGLDACRAGGDGAATCNDMSPNAGNGYNLPNNVPGVSWTCTCSDLTAYYDDSGVCRNKPGCDAAHDNGLALCRSGTVPDATAACVDHLAPLAGYSCACTTTGWHELLGKCEQVDECNPVNFCDLQGGGGTCADLGPPLVGHTCTNCEPGYENRYEVCVDVDWCTDRGGDEACMQGYPADVGATCTDYHEGDANWAAFGYAWYYCTCTAGFHEPPGSNLGVCINIDSCLPIALGGTVGGLTNCRAGGDAFALCDDLAPTVVNPPLNVDNYACVPSDASAWNCETGTCVNRNACLGPGGGFETCRSGSVNGADWGAFPGTLTTEGPAADPGARCIDKLAPLVGFKCDCSIGFEEVNNICEDIDDCASNPCANGVCTDTGINSYFCDCSATGFKSDFPLGFYGCEIPIIGDDCAGQCGTGSCIDDGALAYHCNCAGTGTQWNGIGNVDSNCAADEDICLIYPPLCKHGSVCADVNTFSGYVAGTDYTCDCGVVNLDAFGVFTGTKSSAGYNGNRCELDADECALGGLANCINTGNLGVAADADNATCIDTPAPGIGYTCVLDDPRWDCSTGFCVDVDWCDPTGHDGEGKCRSMGYNPGAFPGTSVCINRVTPYTHDDHYDCDCTLIPGWEEVGNSGVCTNIDACYGVEDGATKCASGGDTFSHCLDSPPPAPGTGVVGYPNPATSSYVCVPTSAAYDCVLPTPGVCVDVDGRHPGWDNGDALCKLGVDPAPPPGGAVNQDAAAFAVDVPAPGTGYTCTCDNSQNLAIPSWKVVSGRCENINSCTEQNGAATCSAGGDVTAVCVDNRADGIPSWGHTCTTGNGAAYDCSSGVCLDKDGCSALYDNGLNLCRGGTVNGNPDLAATCQDVPAPGAGYVCVCSGPGFEKVGGKCEDIQECTALANPCDDQGDTGSVCNDVLGPLGTLLAFADQGLGHTCTCTQGYESVLGAQGYVCQDIDACVWGAENCKAGGDLTAGCTDAPAPDIGYNCDCSSDGWDPMNGAGANDGVCVNIDACGGWDCRLVIENGPYDGTMLNSCIRRTGLANCRQSGDPFAGCADRAAPLIGYDCLCSSSGYEDILGTHVDQAVQFGTLGLAAGVERCVDINMCTHGSYLKLQQCRSGVVPDWGDGDATTVGSPLPGATCNDWPAPAMGFDCDCSLGWEEVAGVCEDIDDCASVPCMHGGVCSDAGAQAFSCDCTGTGYRNDAALDLWQCNIPEDGDDCASAPCLNGGTCIDAGGNAYICDCTGTGFEGVNCEIDDDKCDGAIIPPWCSHGGVCTDDHIVPNEITCDCGFATNDGNGLFSGSGPAAGYRGGKTIIIDGVIQGLDLTCKLDVDACAKAINGGEDGLLNCRNWLSLNPAVNATCEDIPAPGVGYICHENSTYQGWDCHTGFCIDKDGCHADYDNGDFWCNNGIGGGTCVDHAAPHAGYHCNCGVGFEQFTRPDGVVICRDIDGCSVVEGGLADCRSGGDLFATCQDVPAPGVAGLDVHHTCTCTTIGYADSPAFLTGGKCVDVPACDANWDNGDVFCASGGDTLSVCVDRAAPDFGYDCTCNNPNQYVDSWKITIDGGRPFGYCENINSCTEQNGIALCQAGGNDGTAFLGPAVCADKAAPLYGHTCIADPNQWNCTSGVCLNLDACGDAPNYGQDGLKNCRSAGDTTAVCNDQLAYIAPGVGYTCTCSTPGWDPSGGVCTNIDGCIGNTCALLSGLAQHACTDRLAPLEGKICDCTAGYHDIGDGICRDIDACDPLWGDGTRRCKAGGATNAICIDQAPPGESYYCDCDGVAPFPTPFSPYNVNGNAGWDPTSGTCVDIDACGGLDCSNVVMDCQITDPINGPCVQVGACIQQSGDAWCRSAGDSTAVCVDIWDSLYKSPFNTVHPVPGMGHTCTVQTLGWRDDHPDWIGVSVNVNECVDVDGITQLHDCKNGVVPDATATCIDTAAPGTGYICDCAPGWQNVNHQILPSFISSCEDIDDCLSNPCQNGGTCIDNGATPKSYTCDCTGTGYSGILDCATWVAGTDCAVIPCQHGGICTDLPDPATYSCDCGTSGWYGPNCQFDINDCDSSPCINGGLCTNLINNAYTCSCVEPGYAGARCELDRNACVQDNGLNNCRSGGESAALCVDVPAPGIGYTCTTLIPGYNCNFGGAPAPSCQNINGCAGITTCDDNGDPSALCQDNAPPGVGFRCSCGIGYEDIDGVCTDIDKCAAGGLAACRSGDDPFADCTDLPPPSLGYTCTASVTLPAISPPYDCTSGVCYNVNHCTTVLNGNLGCTLGGNLEATCTDVPAPGFGYTCSTTNTGWDCSGGNCVDIDDCAAPLGGTALCQAAGDVGAVCNQAVAPAVGHTCDCTDLVGVVVGTNQFKHVAGTCVNVDGCITGLSQCRSGSDFTAACFDNPAPGDGHFCICSFGWEDVGGVCQDVDACLPGTGVDGNSKCQSDGDLSATCVDESAPGLNYHCDCDTAAYEDVGGVCRNLDNCFQEGGIAACKSLGDVDAVCHDNPAPLSGRTCTCSSVAWYEMPSNICGDYNACGVATGGLGLDACRSAGDTGASCSDAPAPLAGYSCGCNTGFEEVNGVCQDIDACTPANGGLVACRSEFDYTATCIDTPAPGIATAHTCDCTGVDGEEWYDAPGGICRNVDACTDPTQDGIGWCTGVQSPPAPVAPFGSNPDGGAICNDFAAPLSGFWCSCSNGFEEVGADTHTGVCTEIDDCLAANGNGDVLCAAGTDPLATCQDVQGPLDGWTCIASNTGYDCSSGVCVNDNECASGGLASCVSMGDGAAKCNDVLAPGTGYTCQCSGLGYFDDAGVCKNVDACTPNPCAAAGDGLATCADNPAPLTGHVCTSCGFGYRVVQGVCTDVDECVVDGGLQNCRSGGDTLAGCVPDAAGVGNGYTCTCSSVGWNGISGVCLDIDDCLAPTAGTPGLTSCRSGGDGLAGCVDVAANPLGPTSGDPANAFTCVPSSPGYDCDTLNPGVCTNINGCIGHTCDVEDLTAFCVDVPAPGVGYICGCSSGYTDVGGTCVNDNDCASNPCKNGGTCVDNVGVGNSYTCTCTGTGYQNPNCNTLITGVTCLSNPCQNNGICVDDGPNQFLCDCEITNTGFTGPLCTIDVDDCASSPCIHGGICTDTGLFHDSRDIQCDCTPEPGWAGDRCQLDKNECALGGLGKCRTDPVNGGGDPNAVCIDHVAPGVGYTCQASVPGWQCSPGVWPGLDGQCVDLDPCVDTGGLITCQSAGDITAGCNVHAYPLSTHNCQCTTGFVNENNVCVDRNDCLSKYDNGVGKCRQNGDAFAVCSDVPAPGLGFTCTCSGPGYDPTDLCKNVQGCQPGPFPNDGSNLCKTNLPSANCFDVAAPGVGYTCSTFQTGWDCSGLTCIDKNECTDPVIDGDGKCALAGDPSSTCVDATAPGVGFSCLCSSGYVASSNDVCVNKDGCVLGLGQCKSLGDTTAVCGDVAPPGVGHYCSCSTGYEDVAGQCTNINACSTYGGTASCQTFDGGATCNDDFPPSLGWSCTCSAGYKDVNGKCENIDACKPATGNGLALCRTHDAIALCVDRAAPLVGHDCTCSSAGFVDVGGVCQDVNGCIGHTCTLSDTAATCIDAVAPLTGYTCQASSAAYVCSGNTCVNYNACSSGSPTGNLQCKSGGDASATCTDVLAPGVGHSCTCTAGFTDVAGQCVDKNACLLAQFCASGGDTFATCQDVPAPGVGYTCTPSNPNAYDCSSTVAANSPICLDRNACVKDNGDALCKSGGDAGAVCIDTPAPGFGYMCASSVPSAYNCASGTCLNIDGCLLGAPDCTAFGDVSATCVDVLAPGSGHTCVCNTPAFTADGGYCKNTDACIGNPCAANGDSFSICSDTPAPGVGHTCVFCSAGYEAVNGVCVDVNACTERGGNDACKLGGDTGAICSDRHPPFDGYTCACSSLGYSGISGVCTDINACTQQSGDTLCKGSASTGDPGALCFDVPAPGLGHTCVASQPGYDCSSGICVDFNACVANTVCQFNDTAATCLDLDPPSLSYTCLCNSGYETSGDGLRCVDSDDCASNPCANGVCTDTGRSQFSCDCTGTGFQGLLCNFPVVGDDCAPNPCLHGGLCTDTGANDYSCNCLGTGYLGTNCEIDSDDCASLPCKHGGVCTDEGVFDFSCNCLEPGWDGDTCENDKDSCIGHTCAQDSNGDPSDAGATCVDHVAPAVGYHCLPGGPGYVCDGITTCRDINGCTEQGGDAACVSGNDDFATCTDVSAPATGWTCNCNPGWVFVDGICKDIDDCAPSGLNGLALCRSGGDAFAQCNDGAAPSRSYTCVPTNAAAWDCSSGICQNIDECDAATLQECRQDSAGNPTDVTAVCIDLAPPLSGHLCQPGAIGYECKSDPGHCLDVDGCTDGGGLDQCRAAGDVGALCTDVPATVPPFKGHTCSCSFGFQPVGGSCLNVDGCAAANDDGLNMCRSAGDLTATCGDKLAPATGYNCFCNQGYEPSGGVCVDIDACSGNTDCQSMGDNSATCIDTAAPSLGHTCSCTTGFLDISGVCVNIDSCLTENGLAMCQSKNDYQAKCFDAPAPGSGHTCACSGSQWKEVAGVCENVDACTEENGLSNCRAGGDVNAQCDDLPAPQSGYVCQPSEVGFDCSTGRCDLISCPEDSSRKNDTSSKQCFCDKGFEGKITWDWDNWEWLGECTDILDCVPNPCVNGTCEEYGINDYKCFCDTGFDGDNCENNIDDCDPNPCDNDALCIDGVNDYECDCDFDINGDEMVKGWEGNLCEDDINECIRDQPCQNNGECINGQNGTREYICNCEGTGFRGDVCQYDVDDCDPNPCENDGVCTDTGPNIYYCDCPESVNGTGGFFGQRCENPLGGDKLSGNDNVDGTTQVVQADDENTEFVWITIVLACLCCIVLVLLIRVCRKKRDRVIVNAQGQSYAMNQGKKKFRKNKDRRDSDSISVEIRHEGGMGAIQPVFINAGGGGGDSSSTSSSSSDFESESEGDIAHPLAMQLAARVDDDNKKRSELAQKRAEAKARKEAAAAKKKEPNFNSKYDFQDETDEEEDAPAPKPVAGKVKLASLNTNALKKKKKKKKAPRGPKVESHVVINNLYDQLQATDSEAGTSEEEQMSDEVVMLESGEDSVVSDAVESGTDHEGAIHNYRSDSDDSEREHMENIEAERAALAAAAAAAEAKRVAEAKALAEAEAEAKRKEEEQKEAAALQEKYEAERREREENERNEHLRQAEVLQQRKQEMARRLQEEQARAEAQAAALEEKKRQQAEVSAMFEQHANVDNMSGSDSEGQLIESDAEGSEASVKLGPDALVSVAAATASLDAAFEAQKSVASASDSEEALELTEPSEEYSMDDSEEVELMDLDE